MSITRSLELVTVSSADYLPGTQVMLDSFLRTNDWFCGPIKVICADLDSASQARLIADFPGLQCLPPTDELQGYLAGLVEAHPHLANRARRFHSLDAFDGLGTSPALFVDSDVVFTRSIEEALRADSTIAACGDRAMLVGHSRDPVTLEENAGANGNAGFCSFNAGLMVIPASLRDARTRADIMRQLDPAGWSAVRSDHTDQAVFNRVFGHRVELMDDSFNRMVGHRGRMQGADLCPVEQAKLLHFNGPAKPWRMDETMREMATDPDYAYSLARWHEAYRAYLDRRRKR